MVPREPRTLKEVRFSMNAKAILIGLLLVATAGMAVLVTPATRAATLINGQLVEETGPTTALGGGDHVFVRFGSDAAFGVVYGTSANPNNIYIVAVKARYLGVAQVKDEQGRSYAENRPIKIYTLYAVKLDSLVEFRDSNGNGIANYARVYNSTTDRFSDYINRADTLYKKVDLNTSWTAGSIVQSNGTAYRSWTFNLSAQNLPYAAVANYTGNVVGTLPLVRFTFHLNASLTQVDNATVPQWQVTVGQIGGRIVVTNISRLNDLIVSGKALHYDLKWDQDIEGWTYAAQNTPAASRRILLELGVVVGNLIPAAIVDAWFESRALARMGESGTAQFNTATGTESANDTTGTYLLARRLQSPYVDFGGNWTRIGRFLWVSDSVVDGVSVPVYGQIVAGVRFAAIGEGGKAFIGFALLAGLSFLGGASIVHDPTVTTDVQADLQLPGATGPFGGLFVAAIGVVVIIAIVLLVVAIAIRRKKKGSPPPP